MGKGGSTPKPPPPPPPPPAPPTRGEASSIQATKKRGPERRGVASTVLTSGSSALDDKNIARKTLLGGR